MVTSVESQFEVQNGVKLSMSSIIGLGGGCHWCTEGVFQSLKGITKVEQGWISSEGENRTFSEAVIAHYDPAIITLSELIEIHLYTHSCTSDHTMRNKYRSAVYSYSVEEQRKVEEIIRSLGVHFSDEVITQSLALVEFRENQEEFLNYLYSRPDAPFCKSYIHPKLQLLLKKFSKHLDEKKLNQIGLK